MIMYTQDIRNTLVSCDGPMSDCLTDLGTREDIDKKEHTHHYVEITAKQNVGRGAQKISKEIPRNSAVSSNQQLDKCRRKTERCADRRSNEMIPLG